MLNYSNPSSNGSVSSTQTVSSCYGKAGSESKRHRRVRFPSDPSHLVDPVPSFEDMLPEDKEERYWSPAEYNKIKESARLATLLIMKNSNHDIDLIETVYTTVSCLATILDDEGFDAVSIDPSKLSHHLKAWHESGIGRGLEKYVSSTHRLDRSEVAEDSRNAVLSLSQNPAMDADDIAHVYQKMVRSAALYARVIGEADASSVNEQTTAPLQVQSKDCKQACPNGRLQRPVLARQCAQPYDLTRYLQG